MGTIIKLVIVAIIILVILNIFNEDKAHVVTSKISEVTGVDKNNIDKKLNSATEFVKESSDAVVEIAKEKIEKAK